MCVCVSIHVIMSNNRRDIYLPSVTARHCVEPSKLSAVVGATKKVNWIKKAISSLGK